MTLSRGQAPVGAHIPTLPLRETAKLPPNATKMHTIRQASISRTFVPAKSGDKAASWFRLAPPAGQNHSPAVIEPGLDHASLSRSAATALDAIGLG
jgi:hypothetical protein